MKLYEEAFKLNKMLLAVKNGIDGMMQWDVLLLIVISFYQPERITKKKSLCEKWKAW